MSEAVKLVVLVDPGQKCSCGRELMTKALEIRGKRYLRFRQGRLSVKCEGCKTIVPLGPKLAEVT